MIWLLSLKKWPAQQAAFGIADIQKFYDLDVEDIADGLLIDINSNIHHKSVKKLSLNEIIMISEAAGLSGYFDSKVDWLEYGLVLAKSRLELKSLEIQIESAKVEQFNDSW